MAASLTFLEAYEKDGDSLLDRVVTGDETWVKHVTCETKKQAMEWGHTSSPKRPRKCLQTLSARKIMATVFWDREVVLLVDFLERGSTINSERYCETLKKLRRAIQNKRRGKLSSKICFFMTTPACTRPIALESSWIILNGRCLIICRTVRILRRAATTCFQT